MNFSINMSGMSYGNRQQHPPPRQYQQQQMQQHPGGYQQPQHPPGGYQQQPQHQPSGPTPYGAYSQNFQQNVFQTSAWQALQFNSEDELRFIYEQHKSQTYGAVQAEELQKVMNTSALIRDRFRINWSLELCKIMIAMLDRNKDGMMGYQEFTELLQCLAYWYQTFCQYDANRSGFIEAAELGRCFREKFGYSLSVKAIECILRRYAKAMDDGKVLIAFDDFVALSVRLRAYTEAFRARDRQSHGNQESGSYQFSYDDFLQCTMCL